VCKNIVDVFYVLLCDLCQQGVSSEKILVSRKASVQHKLFNELIKGLAEYVAMEALVWETAGAHGLSTTVRVTRFFHKIFCPIIILTNCFNNCLVEA